MSDFSLFSLFTAGLACFAPLAAAYTQPTGSAPVGNPIYEPNMGSIVPAGQDFNITWGPTTQGTVTLLLLKGPSTNAVPQYSIVEKIPNSGSYIWHVASDLEATASVEGYGLQLIDDATGQYQYSTQFGISNDGTHSNSASSSASAEISTSCSESTAPATTTTKAPVYTSTCTDTTLSVVTTKNATKPATSPTIVLTTSYHATAAPSAAPTKSSNGTIPAAPTGAGSSAVWSVPATYVSPTLSPAATSTTPAYRGDATTLKSGLAGLAAAGVAALFAL